FEIGELLAAALRYRYLNFRPFCIKIILTSPQKSEITDCDTGGCGMWDSICTLLFEYTLIYFFMSKVF
ncbi:hypothetical protein PN478_01135, partial [Dolichospermum circinale CS-534/05]|nr:hypothetical protein [Dolichospermum circinale CS-534/05]